MRIFDIVLTDTGYVVSNSDLLFRSDRTRPALFVVHRTQRYDSNSKSLLQDSMAITLASKENIISIISRTPSSFVHDFNMSKKNRRRDFEIRDLVRDVRSKH